MISHALNAITAEYTTNNTVQNSITYVKAPISLLKYSIGNPIEMVLTVTEKKAIMYFFI